MDRTFFLVYGICDKEITMLSTPYAMHDCETFMITRLVKTINQYRGTSFLLKITKTGKIIIH